MLFWDVFLVGNCVVWLGSWKNLVNFGVCWAAGKIWSLSVFRLISGTVADGRLVSLAKS